MNSAHLPRQGDKAKRIAHTRRRSVFAATALALALLGAKDRSVRAQQETPPPPGAPRSPVLPKPAEKTLANGLRVIVAERGGTPLVSASLYIRNGPELDPPELPGLAAMTASLLTQGTTTRTAQQIAESVEALGGTIDSGARWDASAVSIDVMSTQLEQAVEILADVVRRPAFKEEEIERRRQQTMDQLRVALRQPGTLARLAAARLVFGDAPYGHPQGGTPQSIQNISRADLVGFHAACYRPDNGVLVIGGDIRSSAAFRLAERWFGDWSKPATPRAALPGAGRESPGAPAARRAVAIDKADAAQAAVVLTRLGLRRRDPGYFAGLVANSVLGGGYSARLNQEIRIKRGLSYGASSSLDTRRDVGPFAAMTQTKNESAAEVAALLASELQRLSTERVSDSELTPRKAALIGSFGRSLETAGGLAAQFASLALYDLGLDEINRTIGNIQAVTSADVQQFARAHLGADAVAIVAVGDTKLFLEELRKQFPNVEVIAEADLDFNRAGLRKSREAE
ncbi:MAG: insulinase family protein [Acidobacteria bacterium]|nr:insulinase family protein [Acidobacteriota bacterium]